MYKLDNQRESHTIGNLLSRVIRMFGDASFSLEYRIKV